MSDAGSSDVPAKSDDEAREIQLILPSDVRFVPILEAVTSRIASDLKFDADTAEVIGVAVVEAAMNAIKHGNQYDLSKRAHFTFRVEPDRLTIVVKDEGEGFQPDEVADPFDGDNLFRDHGRGLLMIRAYMDEAYHNEDGTQLTMVKMRPA